MKIVIDIPKKDWEFLKESDGCRWSRAIIESVINGIPLPKGHGRLIDADKLYQKMLDLQGTKRERYLDIDEVRKIIKNETPTEEAIINIMEVAYLLVDIEQKKKIYESIETLVAEDNTKKEDTAEWVFCKDRLPEECEWVLLYAERNAYDDGDLVGRKKVVDIGWQIGGKWHLDGCSGVVGIAWQTLPKPPKAEEK